MNSSAFCHSVHDTSVSLSCCRQACVCTYLVQIGHQPDQLGLLSTWCTCSLMPARSAARCPHCRPAACCLSQSPEHLPCRQSGRWSRGHCRRRARHLQPPVPRSHCCAHAAPHAGGIRSVPGVCALACQRGCQAGHRVAQGGSFGDLGAGSCPPDCLRPHAKGAAMQAFTLLEPTHLWHLGPCLLLC